VSQPGHEPAGMEPCQGRGSWCLPRTE
jgi:hypothetical protein